MRERSGSRRVGGEEKRFSYPKDKVSGKEKERKMKVRKRKRRGM